MDEIIAPANISTVELLVFVCGFFFLLCVVVFLVIALWKIKTQFKLLKSTANTTIALEHNKIQTSVLVNLPIRHQFIQFLTEIFPLARQRNEKLALLLLDLDNFKHINDALGIDIGDFLLKKVADRIVSEVNNDSHIISHFGGGEFVILIGYYDNNIEHVASIANRLLLAINDNFHVVPHDILISASIGICIFPDHTDTPENLLRYADMARYNAKQSGKNIYSFYNENMNKQILNRTLMYSDLRKALEKEEFVLYYQPKICAITGVVTGAEALIRWAHPVKGLIVPDIFIPIAEDSGMIIPMGVWILRTACLDLKRIQAAGLPNFTIAVNLSPYQFNHGDVAGNIAEILWETGTHSSFLEIEMTESVIMGNPEKTLLMLRVLKAMGIRIAVDDFGTGYSSLSYLRNFPIDTLKIDKSFIKNMHLEPDSVTIVSTIISMAKQLGLEVVAEGVEHKEEVDLLVKEGCNYFQGYFYSAPVPVEKLLEFIKQRV